MPESTPSASVPIEVALRLSAGLKTGVLPNVAAQVGLGAEFRAGWFVAALGGSWAVPQDKLDGSTAGGQFQMLGSALDLCILVAEERVRVPLCARAEGGAVFGEGRGVSTPESSALPWVGLGLSASAWVGVGAGISVGLDGSLTGGVVRPRYSIEGAGELHTADPVSASLGVGVAWRFP